MRSRTNEEQSNYNECEISTEIIVYVLIHYYYY